MIIEETDRRNTILEALVSVEVEGSPVRQSALSRVQGFVRGRGLLQLRALFLVDGSLWRKAFYLAEGSFWLKALHIVEGFGVVRVVQASEASQVTK